MADSNIVTQEEMALRRRARRRLVGAVAIALAAVVALPMLFDPEPKPLGPEVDLRIPSKDTPFESAQPVPATATAPAMQEPAPLTAEPTLPVPPQALPTQTQPAQTDAAAIKPAQSKPANESKPDRPAAKETAKPEKIETRVEKKSEELVKPVSQKTETKPATKADPAFASKGFFLQLGAFGSEINAKQLQEKVQAAGFKASLNAANGQFRVRVGPIPEHDKALEMQGKLKAKGFSPVLLGP